MELLYFNLREQKERIKNGCQRYCSMGLLQKKMTWEQLKNINNKRVLDFGSGNGMTANHFAIDNEVIAIEPNEKILKDRFTENDYTQIKGGMKELKNFEDGS